MLPTSDRPTVTAEEFAAAIAPVIDGVHARLHELSAPVGRAAIDRLDQRPPHPGLLITLRFRLLGGPVPVSALLLSVRYSPVDTVHRATSELVDAGWLSEQNGVVSATDRTSALLNQLYDVHAATIGEHWEPVDVDLSSLAGLVQQLLLAGEQTAGPAFSALSPPVERPGDHAGLLLFNRLAALRYHRSDAHAAAWAAEGLTADQIVDLGPGVQRERIEEATNQVAAAPFAALTSAARTELLAGLGRLPC